MKKNLHNSIDWSLYINNAPKTSSHLGDWGSDEVEKRDYQRELDDIPTEEIERYLRKKKLDKIKEK